MWKLPIPRYLQKALRNPLPKTLLAKKTELARAANPGRDWETVSQSLKAGSLKNEHAR